jgi:GNAT superfamily N-acetyltransferase
MRMPFALIVAVIVSGPALRADSFTPWWGQTTSALRVRQSGEVVDTLPRGAMVYVIGERPGFLSIRYVFEPVVAPPWEVAAAYVVPRALPEAITPELGVKDFYAADGMVYDVLPGSTAEVVITVGKDGQVRTLRTADHSGSFLPVFWDYANHGPALLGRGNAIGRYFYGASLLLGRAWGWLLILVLFAALAVLGRIGEGTRSRFTFASYYVAALLVGYGFARFLEQFIERYAVARGWIAPYVTTAGLLPLPSVPWIKPWQAAPFPWLFYLFFLAWVPCFLVLHLAALRALPKAVKGLHFLAVRHPLEKALDNRSLDTAAVLEAVPRPAAVPPRFVSENLTRRLDALRRRVDAETAVLGSAIERERARAANEEKQS